MKITTYNVRGLGGREKRCDILKLVRQHFRMVVCFQDTKWEFIDDSVCDFSLWGSKEFGFSFRPSMGTSGGILTLWDASEVEV